MFVIPGLTGRRFPIHPQPFQDELLTHWVVRLAHANKLKAQTVTDLLFGYPSSFWARDQDKMANPQVIEAFSEISGKDPFDLLQLTLRPYGDYLYAKHNYQGNTRWILPLGIYHRVRRRGIQFCPLCLRSETPYFRKYWRLSFYVECDHHHVLMQDTCPNCQSPVMYHRSEMGHRYRRGYPPIVNCYRCGFNLSWAGAQAYDWADQQAMLATQAAIFCHFRHIAFLHDRTFDSSQIFFDALYLLCNRIGSSRRTGELYHWVQEQIRPGETRQIDHSIRKFDDRPVWERARLLEAAFWLLCDWPYRLRHAIRELNIHPYLFKSERGEKNTWLLEGVPPMR